LAEERARGRRHAQQSRSRSLGDFVYLAIGESQAAVQAFRKGRSGSGEAACDQETGSFAVEKKLEKLKDAEMTPPLHSFRLKRIPFNAAQELPEIEQRILHVLQPPGRSPSFRYVAAANDLTSATLGRRDNVAR